MNKIFIKSSVIAFCFLFSHATFAQDTITVEAGLGTLEEAINTHEGDAVYKLKAGSIYILESIVEVSDMTMGSGRGLHIIGEKTDEMPAVIQVGVEGARSAFPMLFDLYNDLTIKDVFLTAQNIYGVTGDGVISINDRVKVVLDNCVIDPSGENMHTFGG